MKRLLPQSEFAKNVLTLMTGTAIAQIIPIVISPVLTRIFSPEEFGVFAVYTSVVFIVASFSCGKYELAIMLPKEEKSSFNLTVLSIIICSVVTIISLFPFVIFHSEIATLLQSEAVGDYLYFAPISIFLVGCYQALFYYNSRKKFYKQISISKVSQASSMAGVNIVAGATFGGAGSLIFGQIIGQIMGVVSLLRQKTISSSNLKKDINIKEIMYIGKLYKKFPLVFSFSYGLNTLAGNLTPFILTASFDVRYAGYFLIVQKAIVSPINIIAKSIGNVFFQKASQQKDCRKLYLIVSIGLFSLGLLPTVILLLFSDTLFAFFFGEAWRPAGEIAQILIIMFFLSFATIPVSQFSTIHQKAIYNVVWQSALISCMLFSWYLGTSNESVFIYFISYAIFQSLLYIVGYFYEFHLCKKQARA